MRRMVGGLAALVGLAVALAGCGPKVSEVEKTTPVPELYKNPKGYRPPSSGNAPTTGQPQTPPPTPPGPGK